MADRTDRALYLLLAAANFGVGMGAFVAVGVLSPVAAGLGVTPAAAGWMMTVYALAYAPASPLLVALTGGWDRRSVLLTGLAVFAAGSAGVALAPGLGAALAARAVMAVGGGLVTPVAAAIAIARSAPEARGRALALVFGGLTLAQVLGVPAGAWLAYALGWRAVFALVALVVGLVLLLALRRLPAGLKVPPVGLRDLGRALVSPWRLAAVGFTVLFLGAVYTLYSFVGPLVETRNALTGNGVAAVLFLFGLGAMAGNLAGGRMADRLGPARALALLVIAQAVMLPLIAAVALPLALLLPAVLVWSICGWAFMAPQQMRLAALDPAGAPILLALNAAAIYLGAALGTLAGGAALGPGQDFARAIPAALALLAAGMGTLALVPRLRRQFVRM